MKRIVHAIHSRLHCIRILFGAFLVVVLSAVSLTPRAANASLIGQELQLEFAPDFFSSISDSVVGGGATVPTDLSSFGLNGTMLSTEITVGSEDITINFKSVYFDGSPFSDGWSPFDINITGLNWGLLGGTLIDVSTSVDTGGQTNTFGGVTFDTDSIAVRVLNPGGNAFGFPPLNFNQTLTLDLTTTHSAIPLPAALPLFGTGLGILGFMGWRRRRKAQAV